VTNFVIPAKAGIQRLVRHSTLSASSNETPTHSFFSAIPAKAGSHARSRLNVLLRAWAPAYAGVTKDLIAC
jgi:hypothetical protein